MGYIVEVVGKNNQVKFTALGKTAEHLINTLDRDCTEGPMQLEGVNMAFMRLKDVESISLRVNGNPEILLHITQDDTVLLRPDKIKAFADTLTREVNPSGPGMDI